MLRLVVSPLNLIVRMLLQHVLDILSVRCCNAHVNICFSYRRKYKCSTIDKYSTYSLGLCYILGV